MVRKLIISFFVFLIVNTYSNTLVENNIDENNNLKSKFENYQLSKPMFLIPSIGGFVNTNGWGMLINLDLPFCNDSRYILPGDLSIYDGAYNGELSLPVEIKFNTMFQIFRSSEKNNYNAIEGVLKDWANGRYDQLKNKLSNNKSNIGQIKMKLFLGLSFNKWINFYSKAKVKQQKMQFLFSFTPVEIEVLDSVKSVFSIIKTIRHSNDLINYIDAAKAEDAELIGNDITKSVFNYLGYEEGEIEALLTDPKTRQIFFNNAREKILNILIYNTFGNTIEVLKTTVGFRYYLSNNIVLNSKVACGFLPVKYIFPLKNIKSKNTFEKILDCMKVEFNFALELL